MSATTFQAIAFGELFEVAYFTSLLNNITNNVPGYEIGSGAVREVVVEALSAIQAQEELHAIGVNAILSSAGRTPVAPCQYIFPVDNFDAAIAGAQAFTDAVVLGGLQDALNTFVTAGDGEVVPLLTSVVGQEVGTQARIVLRKTLTRRQGEQNGFFRTLQAHVPSALPFLTASAGPFGFSYINQNFVVPGSCQTAINVPIFSPLRLQTSPVQARDQRLSFSFTNDKSTSTSMLSLVYINQQNLPIVVPIQNTQTSGEEVNFQAKFPYAENEMNGLTIAVVTKGSGPFPSVDAVANATVFGPAISTYTDGPRGASIHVVATQTLVHGPRRPFVLTSLCSRHLLTPVPMTFS